jgi:hypothetical protein
MPRVNRIAQDRPASGERVTITLCLSDEKWRTIGSVLGSWRKTFQLALIIFMITMPPIAAGAGGLIWMAHGHNTALAAGPARAGPGHPGPLLAGSLHRIGQAPWWRG